MLNHGIKSHRGRATMRQDWALVIVDTSTRPATGFARMVPDRKKETLFRIFNEFVRPK
jgi:transposase-like protein